MEGKKEKKEKKVQQKKKKKRNTKFQLRSKLSVVKHLYVMKKKKEGEREN